VNRQDAENAKFFLKSAFLAREAFSGDAGLDEVGAVALGAEGFAAGLDAEGAFHRAESEAAGNAVIEDTDAVVLELDDLAAVDANEVVVGRAVEEVGIVGGLAVAKIDFLEEGGLGEEGESAVEGGSGGAGVRSAEAFPKLVGAEVLVSGKNRVNDGVALAGLAQSLLFDEGVEALPDLRGHGRSMNTEP
jgi:hypothetical protein